MNFRMQNLPWSRVSSMLILDQLFFATEPSALALLHAALAFGRVIVTWPFRMFVMGWRRWRMLSVLARRCWMLSRRCMLWGRVLGWMRNR